MRRLLQNLREREMRRDQEEQAEPTGKPPSLLDTFFDWLLRATRRTLLATIAALLLVVGGLIRDVWARRSDDIEALRITQRQAEWDVRYNLNGRLIVLEQWREVHDQAGTEQRIVLNQTLARMDKRLERIEKARLR